MHSTTTTLLLLTTVFATLALAAPTLRRDDQKYYGISLYINVHPLPDTPLNEPAPMELNVLNSNFAAGNGTLASQISFDPGVHFNIPDLDRVECRAYKDAHGTVPGSVPFTAKMPAVLSATGVERVGSVLCYVT